MKKYQILLASLLTTAAAFAQTGSMEEVPNRILVTNTAGNYEGFVIDYLDSISFARVDGEVPAKVDVNQVALDSLKVTIKRTPECNYYKLAVLSQVTANQLPNDVVAISYINSLPSGMVPVLYDDFDNGLLSGISLIANADYALMTIGFDRYGVASGVYRADFSTPAPDIVGNPQVEAKLVEAQLNSFTISFTPNEDVQSYWCVAGEKGELEKQYEMFAPMFGFNNMSQMIQMWGIQRQGPTENTWKDMSPNTEYEVYISMTDVEGNTAPYQVFEVSTLDLGGHGDAWVDIELSAYELAQWGDEMLPSQYIQFDPNEEASCYRFKVYPASQYDADPDIYDADLRSDPPMPMAYWFFYDPIETDFQINPSNECVAIAAAKNIDGVWGEINKLRFTTPDECPGYTKVAPVRKGTLPRITPQQAEMFQKGQLPKLPSPKKVELK